MKPSASLLAGLLSLAARTGRADPTWPAATDEMEEIVFQLSGHRGRLFSDLITPCNNEAAGPGRVTASEWLRVAFHDMATANRFSGTGGIDASLQFELNNGENTGPGHRTTLAFYANYLSSRSSMADLIAAGTYASVRGCGGLAIPLKLGRKDASAAGSTGVPQPQNSIGTFRQQFDRMGFTSVEMVQVTACGHTLGGVHTAEFPELVPAGTGVNGQVGFDGTVAVFDNKVATEYIDGTTTNPLVVGPSVRLNRHSDFKVFNSDGNATINAMSSLEAFQNVCKTVLQKMIDVVPRGVTLTEPIVPYMVKPVDMQLTLNTPGNTLLLTGSIRVRTTDLPGDSILNVVLTWKDRNGGDKCGSAASCSTTSTQQGVASGFDDTFAFFPISTLVPASSGISSFTIKINLRDGTSQEYDNNGNSYPMNDGIILQKPQSCLLQGTGALTATALVRNDLKGLPVNLGVSYLVPRNNGNNPVPALNTADVVMTEGDCFGSYTVFSGSFTIPGGLSYNAKVSVTAGEGETAVTDDFNHAGNLGGSCLPFSGSVACGGDATSSVISSSTSSTPVSSSTQVSSSVAPSSVVSSSQISSSTQISSSSIVVSSSVSSITASPTPARKSTVGGYSLIGCWTEGTGVRALGGAVFTYDEMTLESCMNDCAGFDFWGTEYGRECYCANSVHSSSQEAPEADCNMLCAGDPTEYCGAGNRIELYSTTATRSTSTTPTPTATLARQPTVGAYTLVGCQTEATVGRALSQDSYADDSMTLESCATYCNGYTYFATEYGRECYCGNSLNDGSIPATQTDCSMTCAGNPFQYCGAGNRLELYRLSALPSSAITAPSATSTPGITPTVSPYSFIGCYTEPPTGRALTGATYASALMTLESCAEFCSAFKYFGTEYSAECFCGDSLPSSSVNASPSDCSMTCAGNNLQYCGGPSRLQMYERDDIAAPPQPSHPATVLDGAWSFSGCRTEATGVRALSSKGMASAGMTLEICAEFCQGHKYFGTEYGAECYCGEDFEEGSVEAGEADCSMVCGGDGEQFCGAGNRLSVYEKVEA
ncbi:hypothetical protein OQA88_1880 [Cercophora sp. LCS_1]